MALLMCLGACVTISAPRNSYGDMRSDNVFMPKHLGEEAPVAVDLQLAMRGPGVYDVMYSSVWNMQQILTNEIELELLEHYYTELTVLRPDLRETYSFIELGHDYALAGAYLLYQNCVATKDAIASFQKNRGAMQQWYRGMDSMMQRWNASDIIRQGKWGIRQPCRRPSSHHRRCSVLTLRCVVRVGAGVERAQKDPVSGSTTMLPITDDVRLAVLPDFFKDYVKSRAE
jgi:hypothetical protein